MARVAHVYFVVGQRGEIGGVHSLTVGRQSLKGIENVLTGMVDNPISDLCQSIFHHPHLGLFDGDL